MSSTDTLEQSVIQADRPRTLEVTKENHFVDIGAIAPVGWPRQVFKLVQPLVEHLFGFSDLWRLHAATIYSPFDPVEISRRAFKYLDVSWEISGDDFKQLESIKGPLVIVSNHPFGGIDSLALAQLLDRIRPGKWKFLSNIMTSSIRGLADSFIPLDPLGVSPESRRLNKVGLYETGTYLKQGGLLGLFPGGRVSHKQKRYGGNVADRAWNGHFLRQANRAGATVVCVYIPGSNSKRFLKVPARWPKLRALFLARELTRPTLKKVSIKIASVSSPEKVARLVKTPNGVEQLRADCFLRPDLDIPRPDSVSTPSNSTSVAKAPPSNEVIVELNQLSNSQHGRMVDYNRFTLYFAQGKHIPKTLKSLGCGREITFRAAGQGTGKSCDISSEDDYYHHLILWDRDNAQVAGAYRIGFVEQILSEHGTQGLYLDHVFRINPELYKRMGPSFELSRSYVLPKYQGDPDALAGLWKGLGSAAARLGIKTLFGSVTISNDHHPASQSILVEYLKANHSDSEKMRSFVTARNPFKPITHYHRLVADAYEGQSLQKLTPVIKIIENGERGIPPLIRYYCNLGARYLDYHVEADFGNSLYCLLRVELAKVPQGYLKRFMPEETKA